MIIIFISFYFDFTHMALVDVKESSTLRSAANTANKTLISPQITCFWNYCERTSRCTKQLTGFFSGRQRPLLDTSQIVTPLSCSSMWPYSCTHVKRLRFYQELGDLVIISTTERLRGCTGAKQKLHLHSLAGFWFHLFICFNNPFNQPERRKITATDMHIMSLRQTGGGAGVRLDALIPLPTSQMLLFSWSLSFFFLNSTSDIFSFTFSSCCTSCLNRFLSLTLKATLFWLNV